MSILNIRTLTLEVGDHVIQITMDQAEQLKDELNHLLPLPDLDIWQRDHYKKPKLTNFDHPFFKNGYVSDSTTTHT